MLSLLKIKNIALIEKLTLEFGEGLNLLTGETGSGKSIIVDSLGALTGARVSSDLIKEGETKAQIEGLFLLSPDRGLLKTFEESGVEIEGTNNIELIVRRELSQSGRNRIFVNDHIVTQGFLKKIGVHLADIHGQGEQTTLFNSANHLEILDEYASLEKERDQILQKFREFEDLKSELEDLKEDESQKLQLIDILQFQIDEISRANLEAGEDKILEEEKRRLNNVEKLSNLSNESYAKLYENEEATLSTLDRVSRNIGELAEYESSFGEYREGLESSVAILEDLAVAIRDFRSSLQFSPERLEEIENRLAEISRLKRKYGGSLESILVHLSNSTSRLENIESAELKEEELREKLKWTRKDYIAIARDIHQKRLKAAKKFEKQVEQNFGSVALEKAKFVVNFETPTDFLIDGAERFFTSRGFDRVEFYFSANPGESPKPLLKVASGGESSRIMLILKTTAKTNDPDKTAVFDEVDAGIGGRVAEAVGLKLRSLSDTQQVLCVTHHPQVASLANQHFLVEKEILDGNTEVSVRKLHSNERVEEIARMLAGEQITDSARTHAQELLSGTRQMKKGAT